jgi:hypothetical protein
MADAAREEEIKRLLALSQDELDEELVKAVEAVPGLMEEITRKEPVN